MADNITLTDYYGNGRDLAAKEVSGALYMRHAFSVWNGTGYDDIAYGRQAPAASLPVTLDTTHIVTEDAAAAADPIGEHLIARRKDTLTAAQVSADGDVIALNATAKGQLHVYSESGSTIADNAAFTDGTTPVYPSGFVYDDVAGTALTENDVAAARIDAKRAQVHTLEDGTTRGRYLTITANGTLLIDGQVVDNAAFTDGTTRVVPAAYIYDEVAGTALTENDAGAARMNVNRSQTHVMEDGTTRGRYATVTSTGEQLVAGSVVDNAGFTDGTTRVQPAGFVYDEVAGTALTENDAAAARINVNRAQVAVIEDGTTRGRYATVTSGNQLKTQPDPNTITPTAAATLSITSGGVTQQVFAANSARKYLLIQNLSVEVLWVRFGGSATAAAPSIALSPCATAADGLGGALEYECGAVPTGTVNVIGATTSSAFTALEG